MNRRQFGKSLAGASALVAAGPALLTLQGCTPGQVENEINTILQEAVGIIAVADPGLSWLADFSKATALLKVDEANWIQGGAVQDVINVLTDLQGVCALVSALVPYAQLVAVLVAGINAALALLLPTPAVPVAMARMAEKPNPWIGIAHVSSAKDSRTQYLAACAKNPALALAAAALR